MLKQKTESRERLNLLFHEFACLETDDSWNECSLTMERRIVAPSSYTISALSLLLRGAHLRKAKEGPNERPKPNLSQSLLRILYFSMWKFLHLAIARTLLSFVSTSREWLWAIHSPQSNIIFKTTKVNSTSTLEFIPPEQKTL